MKNKKMALITFIIQIILIVICLVVGILYFLGNKSMLDVLEIVFGIDLLLMGINNYIVHKNIKFSLIYVFVGIIMLIIVLLGKVGIL